MWRAYDVGNGKDVPYSNFSLKEETEPSSLTKITDVPNIKLAFVEVKPRKHQAAKRREEIYRRRQWQKQ